MPRGDYRRREPKKPKKDVRPHLTSLTPPPPPVEVIKKKRKRKEPEEE